MAKLRNLISVFHLATKMTRNACELTAACLYNCFKNILKWFIKFFSVFLNLNEVVYSRHHKVSPWSCFVNMHHALPKMSLLSRQHVLSKI